MVPLIFWAKGGDYFALADSIIAQAGPLPDGEGAGFMAYKSQGGVIALAVT